MSVSKMANKSFYLLRAGCLYCQDQDKENIMNVSKAKTCEEC